MKKIINKSKLIFYAVLMFVFSINISNASEYSEWGTAQAPEAYPTDSSIIIRNYIFSISSILLFVSLFILIISSILFLYYIITKNKQKINKIEKLIILSFIIFVVSFLVSILFNWAPPLVNN